jgi:hypothetical protein
MTPEKIRDVVTFYHSTLSQAGIQPQRINVDSSFGSVPRTALLAHAHYLCDGVLRMNITQQYGKANRHLTAVQMCLSFAGWYTLNELREHNRP